MWARRISLCHVQRTSGTAGKVQHGADPSNEPPADCCLSDHVSELILVSASGLAREVLAMVRSSGQYDVLGCSTMTGKWPVSPWTAPPSLAALMMP